MQTSVKIRTATAACAGVLLLTGCGLGIGGQIGRDKPSAVSADSRSSSVASQTVSPPPASSETVSAAPSRPADYRYDQAVPESPAVGSDYFDDAVFLGDSRTDIFSLHVDLSAADVYAKTGMTVSGVFTLPAIEDNGTQITVIEAVRKKKYAKAYIMFGINECGWDCKPCFKKRYGELVDELHRMNPDMLIYVQSIIPVTQSKSERDPYENNTNIALYNQMLAELCAEKQVYRLDVGEKIVNEDGVLPEDASIDGVHLRKPYSKKWLEYLLTHTIPTGGKNG